jgi:hypothetical protein
VLRCLIRTPNHDQKFAKAFKDSGFLSCDEVLALVRWKYDLGEMLAEQAGGSVLQVLEHCESVISQDRSKQPLNWHAMLDELQRLRSWFPELRTLRLLEQLYLRLYVLHLKSVLVARYWLDWRACTKGHSQMRRRSGH